MIKRRGPIFEELIVPIEMRKKGLINTGHKINAFDVN